LSLNPDDPEHILINVTASMDEDSELELFEYEAELEADIHLDYGYRISLMVDNRNLIYA